MKFEFPGSFDELVHNKPAMIGLGVAGAVGLVVWLRRRGQSGGGSSSGTATSGSGQAGGVGTFDSTGTDIAAFLSQYSDSLNSQLGGYINQLTPLTDALKQAGQTSTIQVHGGELVKPLVEQIARYRPGFTESDLQALNPGMDIWGQADRSGYIDAPGRGPVDQATLQSVFSQGGILVIPRPS